MDLWLYLLIINGVTLFLYGTDKLAAKGGAGIRVPEYILLLAGFLGGTVAAFAGQQLFRHKTRKRSFQLKFWMLTLVQIAIVILQPTEIMGIIGRFIQ